MNRIHLQLRLPRGRARPAIDVTPRPWWRRAAQALHAGEWLLVVLPLLWLLGTLAALALLGVAALMLATGAWRIARPRRTARPAACSPSPRFEATP